MVQIIPAAQRKPSFAERLNQSFAAAADTAGQYQAYQKQQNALAAENEAAKKLGIDLAGFQDPKLRQAVVNQSLQIKGKEGLLGQKQEFLNQILGKTAKTPKNSFSSKVNADQMTPEEGLDVEEKVIGSNFDPENLSDEDILMADAMGFKGLREAKDAAIRKRENAEKEKSRKFEADRDYHSKRSDPIINAAEQVVKNAPINKGLIDQQRRDIASGDTAGIIPFLVDKLGLEAYRNPESARFKTANKQRFVESIHELGGAGARPNQFIEQQLTQAQATLGRSAEANESVLDLEDFVADMKVKRAELELQLAEQDREKFGYAKNDISQRADKLMKDYTEKRQDEMAYNIRQRHEKNMTDQDLIKELVEGRIGPDTPLTMRVARMLMIKNNDDEKKATAEAKRLGFKIPKE